MALFIAPTRWRATTSGWNFSMTDWRSRVRAGFRVLFASTTLDRHASRGTLASPVRSPTSAMAANLRRRQPHVRGDGAGRSSSPSLYAAGCVRQGHLPGRGHFRGDLASASAWLRSSRRVDGAGRERHDDAGR